MNDTVFEITMTYMQSGVQNNKWPILIRIDSLCKPDQIIDKLFLLQTWMANVNWFVRIDVSKK